MRLALELEKRGAKAVVINADSAQVYADLAVLSARPSAEDMQGIEHRLFGDGPVPDFRARVGWGAGLLGSRLGSGGAARDCRST